MVPATAASLNYHKNRSVPEARESTPIRRSGVPNRCELAKANFVLWAVIELLAHKGLFVLCHERRREAG